MSALTRYPVPQAAAAGKVDGPRLHFRLEPTIVPDPVLAFLQPLRGLEVVEAGAVDDPRLYFRLEAAVPVSVSIPVAMHSYRSHHQSGI